MLGQAKTVRALDRAATAIGCDKASEIEFVSALLYRIYKFMERTMSTKKPPLADGVNANFCG
jgi:hypothetical protein